MSFEKCLIIAMIAVTFVKPLKDYALQLRFSNGVEGIADLSEIKRDGVFEQWNNPEFFRSVTIDSKRGTLEWPGEIDLDPYVLYARATGIPIQQVLASV